MDVFDGYSDLRVLYKLLLAHANLVMLREIVQIQPLLSSFIQHVNAIQYDSKSDTLYILNILYHGSSQIISIFIREHYDKEPSIYKQLNYVLIDFIYDSKRGIFYFTSSSHGLQRLYKYLDRNVETLVSQDDVAHPFGLALYDSVLAMTTLDVLGTVELYDISDGSEFLWTLRCTSCYSKPLCTLQYPQAVTIFGGHLYVASLDIQGDVGKPVISKVSIDITSHIGRISLHYNFSKI